MNESSALYILFIFSFRQQTTNEVSVWLIINLCSVLYSFVSMVFIYILFMEHDTTLDRKDVLLIESVLCIINGWYFWSKHRRNSHYGFVSILQLHTFTCGIKYTSFRANSIWMDERRSKVYYKVAPLPFKRENPLRKIAPDHKMTTRFLCQTK